MDTKTFNEYVEQAQDIDIDDVARLLAERVTLRAALASVLYEAKHPGLMTDIEFRRYIGRKIESIREICKTALDS